MDKPKFCKDCKWYNAPNCENPNNMDYDLVTGEGTSKQTPTTLRQYKTWDEVTEFCGPEGSWFEPKEIPLQHRVLNDGDFGVILSAPPIPSQPPSNTKPRYAIDPNQFAPPPDEGDGPPKGPRTLMF